MANLKEEIKRRFEEDKVTYETIGAEIKRHRLALSLTLQSVSSTGCSPSYICKIERNQVKPSSKYLKEICKKVNISEDKIDYLLNSKDILIEAVKLHYFKDINKEKEYYEKLEGLDNYRTEIIRLIFSLTNNNLSEASKSISKIWRLISSLNDLDLMIFAGFYGIYKYLVHDYVEGADYLKLALDFNYDIKYFRPLILETLFKITAKIGSRNTYKYYRLILEEKKLYGENLNLDNIHYNLCLYYLAQNDEVEFLNTKIKIANKFYLVNLDVLYNLIYDKKQLNNIDLSKLNDFVRLAYLLKKQIDFNIEEIDKTTLNSESKILLKYLYYKKHDLDEAYNYLIDVAYSQAINKDLYIYAKYYLNEIAFDIARPAKYKNFYKMYLEFAKVSKVVELL